MNDDVQWVRLCVETYHPIDPGNYTGPVHCTGHPHGHACVTALYMRLPHTTVTDEERHDPRSRSGVLVEEPPPRVAVQAIADSIGSDDTTAAREIDAQVALDCIRALPLKQRAEIASWLLPLSP